MALSFFVQLFALLLQTHYGTSRLGETLLVGQETAPAGISVVQHLITNLIYSTFGFLYIIIAESHFVAVAYGDRPTAVFVLIGAAYLLWSVRRVCQSY
jgi:hypothetical protein